MPQCLEATCNKSTFSKYCRECKSINDRANAKLEAEILFLIRQLSNELDAARDLGESEEYLRGMEHIILFLKELTSPKK